MYKQYKRGRSVLYSGEMTAGRLLVVCFFLQPNLNAKHLSLTHRGSLERQECMESDSEKLAPVQGKAFRAGAEEKK